MSLLAPSVDYSDKDFDSLRMRLFALVETVFPQWSDRDVASFGNILVELFSFIGDATLFTADASARESRLATATQRKNVIALARMLGYRLPGASAATAVVEFSVAAPADSEITLPAGALVRTEDVTDPVRFQLLAAVTIAAGEQTVRGVVEHSETRKQLFDARGIADLDVVLDQVPYLDSSAIVSAANGHYAAVQSLLGSEPNDRHFVVLVDQDDRATVRFGNGRNGAAPTGTISVTYKTGGGNAGLVDAGTLVVVEGTFHDRAGRPVRVSANNPERASGGTNRQSVAAAKLLAPESLRVQGRSVAREDFEINARRLPGVARALMLTSDQDRSIEENSGILYVVPRGGGRPTPALKNEVLRQVSEVYPSTLTFQARVLDPVYRTLTIEARVYVAQGHSPAAVRDRIRANLDAMFRVSEPDGTPNPRVDFGFKIKDAAGNAAGEVAWSDVFNTIRDTVGVRKLGDGAGDLKLGGLPADLRLADREFPTLGVTTIIDGATGALL